MEINLISTNIRFDNPADGEHSWDNRRDHLSRILLRYSPHIVGTQEGREPQLRDLDSLLPQLTLIDSHRDWLSERMYPTLYIDLSKLDVINSGDIWLSETPKVAGSKSFQSSFPRLSTWAHLKFIEDNFEFIVTNTHLDHESETTRCEQIKVLINEIRKERADVLPIVFMGDFNSSPIDRVRKHLVDELSLIDPWISLKKKEQTSYHFFKGDIDNGSRIDWILHDSNFKALEAEFNEETSNDLYPSDHFPLYTKLSLNSAQS
jgi:endonuclease/exonuclease/phosphatase family metal-dependent hydrolase